MEGYRKKWVPFGQDLDKRTRLLREKNLWQYETVDRDIPVVSPRSWAFMVRVLRLGDQGFGRVMNSLRTPDASPR